MNEVALLQKESSEVPIFCTVCLLQIWVMSPTAARVMSVLLMSLNSLAMIEYGPLGDSWTTELAPVTLCSMCSASKCMRLAL